MDRITIYPSSPKPESHPEIPPFFINPSFFHQVLSHYILNISGSCLFLSILVDQTLNSSLPLSLEQSNIFSRQQPKRPCWNMNSKGLNLSKLSHWDGVLKPLSLSDPSLILCSSALPDMLCCCQSMGSILYSISPLSLPIGYFPFVNVCPILSTTYTSSF